MKYLLRSVSFFCVFFFFNTNCQAFTDIPEPQGMDMGKAQSALALRVNTDKPHEQSASSAYLGEIVNALNNFLGIPYRNDGAINEKGEYTLFSDESKRFSSSGLNCSGFVLGASRFLLQDNITIANAKKDRLNDSGPGALLGEDWDFGWDLIQNIAEGRNAHLLLPQGGTADPFQYNGLNVPSFDLHGKGVWDDLLRRLKPRMLYLLSYSKPSTLPGYKLQHYHVGLMFREGQHIWMYQTTTQSKKVYRRDMNNMKEKSDFMTAFANRGKGRKRITVIEVPLP